VVAQLLFTFQA